mmetsp:Transcript_6472/g.16985  ORF Transcript_6472/g.16985 Transcript_6472/m.16985 type:complete len:209 (+) Transcript_6472:1402-2028(+)
MHLQDAQPVGAGGHAHVDGAVKASGAEQRVVERGHTVGGAYDEHLVQARKAVHLLQQLEQPMLTLRAAAVAAAVAARLADGVNLVNEHDCGRVGARRLEKVAHARGGYALEHLNKLGAIGAEEGDARLARHSLGQVRLARARRPLQQDAAWHLGAHAGVLLVAHHHGEDLLNVSFHLVDARHVIKRHARLTRLPVLLIIALKVEGLGG